MILIASSPILRDLGVGKTSLSRGIIRRKMGDMQMRVTSPSYLLDNVYDYFDTEEDETRKKIHHMDLYRLPTGLLPITNRWDTSLFFKFALRTIFIL